MFTRSAISSLIVAAAALIPDARAQQVSTRRATGPEQEWRFTRNSRWGDWQPNEQVQDVRFESDCVSFRTTGSDPIIIGPLFEWPRATNGQHLEIEIDCEAPGGGEFFFTNTTEGKYGGFDGKWHVPVAVPSAGRQVVPVWPFWETLGRVIRVRFDPPSGMRCRLYSIRIVGDKQLPNAPSWTFAGGVSSWQPMYAIRPEPSASGLRVRAAQPMALMVTGVEPFAAKRRSIMHLDAECPGEHTICFYWANREEPGLWGEPIKLPPAGGGPIAIDLRRFPEWKGTITNLAIGFGTYGGEVLTLRSLTIKENDPSATFLRLRYLGYSSGVGRPGQPAELRVILEHAAGPPLPAGEAVVSTDDNASCPEPRLPIEAVEDGGRIELRPRIIPREAGQTRIALSMKEQQFVQTLKVDPAIHEAPRHDYSVPQPKPVTSDYQIGVYYYPGWSGSEMYNWKRQAGLPERDPLLGWYKEGRPEVADWHIKWAVESGISFMIYDWYWRDGREQHGAALNDGLLNSRYGNLMKFAVMWANHKPFSGHTPQQLLEVTDYWVARYLRRPNYLVVDGKPYVSFYCPQELLTDLGSSQRVREALDAMRERTRTAGLPGLHIGAIDIASQVDPAVLKQAGFDSLTSYTYISTGATPVAHSLYRQYVNGFGSKWERLRRGGELPYIPALAVGWDGPVWYGPRSQRRLGRHTEDLEEGLGRLKTYLDETAGRMAILEAWNEWGEGAYLEPNVEFGFGDLEAVRRVFARPGDWPVYICPQDMGLYERYDQRHRPVGSRPHSSALSP